jgi:mRNA interferase MazF
MVNSSAYIPDRKDIVWINFDPQKGKESKKTRPVLVISPKDYNAKSGLFLCVPITSKVKKYPFEVAINNKHIVGAILCDQLRNMDWKERNISFIEKCEDLIFFEVVEKIRLLID